MNRLTLTALAVALTVAFLGRACQTGDGGTPDTVPLPLLSAPVAKEKTL
jgi:hypothetical protein